MEADTSVTDSRSALHVVEGIDLSGKDGVVTGSLVGLGAASWRGRGYCRRK